MLTQCSKDLVLIDDYKIKFVNKGIANRYPNKFIEVNTKLLNLEYFELLLEIIAHEIRHNDKVHTWNDIKLDLKGFNNKFLYWKFVFTTPNSWVQFFPLYKSSFGMWFIDKTLFYFWSIVLIVIIILWVILV